MTAAPESSNSNSNCDQRRILMSKVESMIALMQSQLLKRFPSSFDKSVEIEKKIFPKLFKIKKQSGRLGSLPLSLPCENRERLKSLFF